MGAHQLRSLVVLDEHYKDLALWYHTHANLSKSP